MTEQESYTLDREMVCRSAWMATIGVDPECQEHMEITEKVGYPFFRLGYMHGVLNELKRQREEQQAFAREVAFRIVGLIGLGLICLGAYGFCKLLMTL